MQFFLYWSTCLSPSFQKANIESISSCLSWNGGSKSNEGVWRTVSRFHPSPYRRGVNCGGEGNKLKRIDPFQPFSKSPHIRRRDQKSFEIGKQKEKRKKQQPEGTMNHDRGGHRCQVVDAEENITPFSIVSLVCVCNHRQHQAIRPLMKRGGGGRLVILRTNKNKSLSLRLSLSVEGGTKTPNDNI